MKNTITVRDLFNRIAIGEAPKKIKIRNDILIYDENHGLNLQDYYYMQNKEYATWKIWYYDLNDKVEIIEEGKKIEKLGEIGDIAYSWSRTEAKLKTKINEIIDKINSMED